MQKNLTTFAWSFLLLHLYYFAPFHDAFSVLFKGSKFHDTSLVTSSLMQVSEQRLQFSTLISVNQVCLEKLYLKN